MRTSQADTVLESIVQNAAYRNNCSRDVHGVCPKNGEWNILVRDSSIFENAFGVEKYLQSKHFYINRCSFEINCNDILKHH